MSLLGQAVVAIWNDITAEGRETFIEWHNREHIPERVAITGFLRGRRYKALYSTPEFYTLYEAKDAAVLTSDAYLERLNNPTPWTKQATSAFCNTLRGVCGVLFSESCGDGGFMLTLRFDAFSSRSGELATYITQQLQKINRMNGICGVHLCVADASASGIETAERKGRHVDVPNWIIMIEGTTPDAVDATNDHLEDLSVHGLAGDVVRGLYSLEFSLTDSSI